MTHEGKEMNTARSGKPVEKIIPVNNKKSGRKAGLFKKLLKYSDNIDKPLSNSVVKDFYK